MAQGEEWGSVVAVLVFIGGGLWVWNHYEIREREPDTLAAPLPTVPLPTYRPTGPQYVVTLDNGTVWRLDADSVTGPRDARMIWIVEDHSKNKSVLARETKTLFRINCETTAYRGLKSIDYDKDGKVLGSLGPKELGDEDNYPPPQSNISVVVRQGCVRAFDAAPQTGAAAPTPPAISIKQD